MANPSESTTVITLCAICDRPTSQQVRARLSAVVIPGKLGSIWPEIDLGTAPICKDCLPKIQAPKFSLKVQR
jgi:hypothetical protein